MSYSSTINLNNLTDYYNVVPLEFDDKYVQTLIDRLYYHLKTSGYMKGPGENIITVNNVNISFTGLILEFN